MSHEAQKRCVAPIGQNRELVNTSGLFQGYGWTFIQGLKAVVSGIVERLIPVGLHPGEEPALCQCR